MTLDPRDSIEAKLHTSPPRQPIPADVLEQLQKAAPGSLGIAAGPVDPGFVYTSDEMARMTIEIVNGVPLRAGATTRERELHGRLSRNVAEIKAAGGSVQLPGEIP